MAARGRQRRLGQNFLVDGSVARRIAAELDSQPARVVEVGPGRGALTVELVDRFPRVLALELDEQLLPELRGRFAGSTLELRQADALREPLEPLLAAEAPWQLAANLPYSVGTAILRRLLPMHAVFTRLVVMLQREVVDRLVARPGDRDHGLMALERAAHADAAVVLRVPPEAFRPRPRVQSAVVALRLRPSTYDPAALTAGLRLAGTALTRPRKMLVNAVPGATGAQIDAAGLDPTRRPGELALEDWLRLSRVMSGEPRILQ